jgi:basic amino acid/polyamine antiporter, APA family
MPEPEIPGSIFRSKRGSIVMADLWAKKPMAMLLAEAEESDVQALTTHDGVSLKRTLSAPNLVALGIGAIIGAGIFVLTGHAAAANAGPAIVPSHRCGVLFIGICC